MFITVLNFYRNNYNFLKFLLKNQFLVLFVCISVVTLSDFKIYGQSNDNQINNHTIQSIHLSFPEAEKIFLKNNLKLLAEHYSINIAEAQVIQAGLFENPTLYFEQNIYSSQTSKYFDFTEQNIVQLTQLFQVAGKRNKRIEFEKCNAAIANYQFQELLRTLKNSLYENLLVAYYLQKSIDIYNKEISYLKRTIAAYNQQYSKGNVSLLETTRLKSFLFSLMNEQFDLEKQLINVQKELNLLLGNSEQVVVVPQFSNELLKSFSFESGTYETLLKEIDSTYLLKTAQQQIKASEANLNLQKALRVPDITAGITYDRQGSFIPHYWGLSISFPLPILNRNQGEILTASTQLQQNQITYQQQKQELKNELYSLYIKAEEVLKFYKDFDKTFETDWDSLIDGVNTNFEKKNISMIEFIDYYESYKEMYLKIYDIEKETILSIEAINALLGKNYLKIIQ